MTLPDFYGRYPCADCGYPTFRVLCAFCDDHRWRFAEADARKLATCGPVNVDADGREVPGE
jgi:hypothetical protein